MNYVAGWRPSSSGATFAKRNPADTGHIIGEFPESSRRDLEDAYRAAREALPTWNGMHLRTCLGLVDALVEIVAAASEEYATLSAMETGQPEGDADVRGGLAAARQASIAAYRFRGELRPRGVISIVTPWNFPVAAPLYGVAAALALGNAVVVHPSPLAPWCVERLVEDAVRAGIPPGVCNLVHGTRRGLSTFAYPVSHTPDHHGADGAIDVMRRAAPSVRASRQLALTSPRAGCDAPPNVCVVLPGADLEAAMTDCREGVFRAAGQRPDSWRLLLITREYVDVFENVFVVAAEHVDFDDRLRGDGAFAGPLIDEAACDAALAWRERVKSAGGRVLLDTGRLIGPRHRMGLYVGPFVAACSPELAIPLTLAAPPGPHALIAPIEGAGEAAAVTRALPGILGASICTPDRDAATSFALSCPAPLVAWNRSVQRLGPPLAGIDALIGDTMLPPMLEP